MSCAFRVLLVCEDYRRGYENKSANIVCYVVQASSWNVAKRLCSQRYGWSESPRNLVGIGYGVYLDDCMGHLWENYRGKGWEPVSEYRRKVIKSYPVLEA